MADELKRMIIKRGTGLPTVPTTPDHRSGTWLTTDIYEGELYQDTDTNKVYSRNSTTIYEVSGSSASSKMFKAIFTTTGATTATLTILQNTTGATATLTRLSTGLWSITFSSAILASAVKGVITNSDGTIDGRDKLSVNRQNSSELYLIISRNGTNTDNLCSAGAGIVLEIFP